ncbi:hypothetical protein Taro_009223 [Colocasia esculenta]|uniref:acid phosphatase n=1 Tax=Colocasia esculenta TaxID=4460 RepID=A0A843TVS6_COLES|nr:hypothetical protein [Colocasia esculenta]
MASSAASADSKPFAVLFVCLGNICRSPAAEAVFRDLVSKKCLDAHFKIDSAGTIGYHEGNRADSRMIAAARRRGIEVTSISRPIRASDFRDFDLILAMDLQNKDDILAAYQRWKVKEQLPEDAAKKVKLMCSYCKRHKETEVPDPYYGGPKGFEKVLDLLEDACSSLLNCIVSEDSHISKMALWHTEVDGNFKTSGDIQYLVEALEGDVLGWHNFFFTTLNLKLPSLASTVCLFHPNTYYVIVITS